MDYHDTLESLRPEFAAVQLVVPKLLSKLHGVSGPRRAMVLLPPVASDGSCAGMRTRDRSRTLQQRILDRKYVV
jgi:hypothetical protein